MTQRASRIRILRHGTREIWKYPEESPIAYDDPNYKVCDLKDDEKPKLVHVVNVVSSGYAVAESMDRLHRVSTSGVMNYLPEKLFEGDERYLLEIEVFHTARYYHYRLTCSVGRIYVYLDSDY